MDLTYSRKNVFLEADEIEKDDIMNYSEGYKNFLDNSKTEREAVKTAIDMLIKEGYSEYHLGDTIYKGDKLFYNNRGKSLFIIKAGYEDISKEGIRILVAHVDSPRLDLKQVPLFEKNDIAFLKTHYYGGIKKYQWLTLPIALHGVITKKNGESIEIKVGEKEGDPIFYISDLLPHLSQKENEKKVSDAFEAENLNIIVGGIPFDKDTKNAVKFSILNMLNKEYGITEEDFLSAEIEAVPALKARDVGFDRSFIASYGHDDRVCAYPEITATIQTATKHTVLTILADKEEIGSEGNTGMQCILIQDIIDMISSSFNANPAVVRANSKCLSADVTSAFDPNFSQAFEAQDSSFDGNMSRAGQGVAMNKFTGARGKSGSNDASAEYIGFLREKFEKDNVIWQTGELGKVDLGGGGTVAKFLAHYNIDTVDLGVPVLSMHAPYELISKADVFSAHKAFSAFIK